MPKLIDLTGRRFNRLTVLGMSHRNLHPKGDVSIYWNCECDCGRTKKVSGKALTSELTKSCGCLNSEVSRRNHTKHGGCDLPEYKVWRGMIYRCHDKNSKQFNDYGGRGIIVCEEWRESFLSFYRHIGPRPSHEYSIERINNDGNYEPGNVKWATRKEQAANKRKQKRKELCSRGHELTPENTYTQLSTGYRQCRECNRMRERNRVRRRDAHV